MQELNNKELDMATATGVVGCFNGEDDQDINTWLRDTLFVARVCNFNEFLTCKLVLLSLRGIALSWISTIFKDGKEIRIEEVVNSLKGRFNSTHKSLSLLSEFFNFEQTQDIQGFRKFCKLANSVVELGMLEYKAVVNIIVARAPSTLNLLLYNFSCTCQDWSDFLRQTEEVVWIAFPINHKKSIQQQPGIKDNKNKISNINRFLPMERCTYKNYDQKHYRLDNNIINNCLKTPCFIEVQINNMSYQALIDTGADVTILSL